MEEIRLGRVGAAAWAEAQPLPVPYHPKLFFRCENCLRSKPLYMFGDPAFGLRLRSAELQLGAKLGARPLA